MALRVIEGVLIITTSVLIVLATLCGLQLRQLNGGLAKIQQQQSMLAATISQAALINDLEVDYEPEYSVAGAQLEEEFETGLEAGEEDHGLLPTETAFEEDRRRKAVEMTPWKQRGFEPHGSYGFVKFAGYRLGPSEMVAIGLGALSMWGRRMLGRCAWTTPHGRVVNGTLRVIHGSEHHDLQYHVIILNCQLWGKAYANVGGTLTMDVDAERLVAYHENVGEVKQMVPRHPYKHNITHCSPPIHDGVDAAKIKIWLDYHMRMGFDHFVMYDVGGINQELLDVLKPYMDMGIVEITPFHDVTKYPNWYFGQVLIINECLYRHRFESKWVAFIDYDEYLWVHGNKTLKDILHEFWKQPYIQHGTTLWDTKKCIPPQGDHDPRWPMERMLFRQPVPFCRDPKLNKKTCHNYWGHRKYFANPRRVILVENHRIVVPRKSGVSLSTDIMLHQHLRGLVTLGWGTCTEIHGHNETVPGFIQDSSVAGVLRDLREHPIDFEEWRAMQQWWANHVAASKMPSKRQ